MVHARTTAAVAMAGVSPSLLTPGLPSSAVFELVRLGRSDSRYHRCCRTVRCVVPRVSSDPD